MRMMAAGAGAIARRCAGGRGVSLGESDGSREPPPSRPPNGAHCAAATNHGIRGWATAGVPRGRSARAGRPRARLVCCCPFTCRSCHGVFLT